MNVVFKYSFVAEVEKYSYLIMHPKEFKDLRSVVWDPFYILVSSLSKRSRLSWAEDIWRPIEPEVARAFKVLKLELPKEEVVCYIYSTGCEGWYTPSKSCIYARITKCKSRGEFALTIIHELAHLATYKIGQSHMEGENTVDECMARFPLSDIVTRLESLSHI